MKCGNGTLDAAECAGGIGILHAAYAVAAVGAYFQRYVRLSSQAVMRLIANSIKRLRMEFLQRMEG